MQSKTQISTVLFSFLFLAVFLCGVGVAQMPHPDFYEYGTVDRDGVLRTEIHITPAMGTLEIINPLQHMLALQSIHGDRLSTEWESKSKHQETWITVPVGTYTLFDKTANRYYPVVLGDNVMCGDTMGIKIVESKPSTDNWAYIPTGSALIGDELGVGSPDEGPARRITTGAFWLKKYETTNAEYCEFLNQQAEIDDRWIDMNSRKCLIKNAVDEKSGKKVFQPDPSLQPNAAEMPVVMVSYFGAVAYCEWLTETTGQQHRLPNETEWEKAARGPFTYVYSYGNRYSPSKANQESGQLRMVKQYKPNKYGLYDMTGNVFEWMGNKYDEKNKAEIMNQALRGGSFVLDGMYQRNSFRMRQSPSVMTDDFGFRVLREISEVNKEEE